MGDGPEARRDRTPATRFESRPADWLSCAEALARVMEGARPLPALRLPVEAAAGMALAQRIESPVTLPPWDNSAMDGYAVRGDSIAGASPDAPRTLRVTGALLAGEVGGARVGAGEAVRIMTGTPVPEGADCVVRVEDTDAELEPGRVAVFSERDRGRNVRPAGQDMRAGETVLPRGTTLGAGQVGVLAACGLTSVEVHRRPVAAVLASGDEIAPAEQFAEVAAGRAIPDTNGPMLAAAVVEAGGEGVRPGIARDTEESVREHLLRGAAQADLLITIGGASMGEGDLFKRVLDELGIRARLLARACPAGQPLRLRAPARGGAGARSGVRAAGQPGIGLRHLPHLRAALHQRACGSPPPLPSRRAGACRDGHGWSRGARGLPAGTPAARRRRRMDRGAFRPPEFRAGRAHGPRQRVGRDSRGGRTHRRGGGGRRAAPGPARSAARSGAQRAGMT